MGSFQESLACRGLREASSVQEDEAARNESISSRSPGRIYLHPRVIDVESGFDRRPTRKNYLQLSAIQIWTNPIFEAVGEPSCDWQTCGFATPNTATTPAIENEGWQLSLFNDFPAWITARIAGHQMAESDCLKPGSVMAPILSTYRMAENVSSLNCCGIPLFHPPTATSNPPYSDNAGLSSADRVTARARLEIAQKIRQKKTASERRFSSQTG